MLSHYDDPAQYPHCDKCLQPQYQAGYDAHVAACTGDGQRRQGRPRKYPIGHTIGSRYRGRYKGRYKHGGARRGEAWEWMRTGEAIQRLSGTKMSQVGQECPSTSEDGVSHRGRKVERKEEVYPVPYVCAALKISRSQAYRLRRYLKLPIVYTSGPGPRFSAFSVSGLRQLLTYLHS